MRSLRPFLDSVKDDNDGLVDSKISPLINKSSYRAMITGDERLQNSSLKNTAYDTPEFDWFKVIKVIDAETLIIAAVLKGRGDTPLKLLVRVRSRLPFSDRDRLQGTIADSLVGRMFHADSVYTDVTGAVFVVSKRIRMVFKKASMGLSSREDKYSLDDGEAWSLVHYGSDDL
jgi:hypothetical protein